MENTIQEKQPQSMEKSIENLTNQMEKSNLNNKRKFEMENGEVHEVTKRSIIKKRKIIVKSPLDVNAIAQYKLQCEEDLIKTYKEYLDFILQKISDYLEKNQSSLFIQLQEKGFLLFGDVASISQIEMEVQMVFEELKKIIKLNKRFNITSNTNTNISYKMKAILLFVQEVDAKLQN